MKTDHLQKRVLQTSCGTHFFYGNVLRTVLGMGMGMNVTAHGSRNNTNNDDIKKRKTIVMMIRSNNSSNNSGTSNSSSSSNK